MVRVLFFSDTHLGFDDPQRPRVARRARGPDFVASFDRALAHATEARVDLVVHGGDLFHRSAPPPAVVDLAAERLSRVARAGIPVVVVCGNHERSRLPTSLFFRHPNLHVIDGPRALSLDVGGARLHVSAFPFVRDVRAQFPAIVRALPPDPRADVNVLLFHQTVEGATVGPSNFTFRQGDDVIPRSALPRGFDVFWSGHIHRSQVLDTPGRASLYYPGSTERTSVAERDETKGFLTFELTRGAPPRATFHPLETRPQIALDVPDDRGVDLARFVAQTLRDAPDDAVVRVTSTAPVEGLAALLRAHAPPSMSFEFGLRRTTPSAERAPARSHALFR